MQTSSVLHQDKQVLRSGLNFPVVGIGASAGGIPALQEFFASTPPSSGMAFVVVMHLSPKHHSSLDTVLQGSTKMPVMQVSKATHLEADHVYVIPPNKHLFLNDSYVGTADLERQPGQHVAIDLFFRTLADVHSNRAFAIIFSGAGADGTTGLTRVKEQGGVTIVQKPEDAEYDSMPQAAIAAGSVDFILPASEIPQKLMELWRNAHAINLPTAADDEDTASPAPSVRTDDETETALQKIFAMLRAHTGHDFRYYKRGTVLRRIERRLQVRGVVDLPSYFAVLKDDAQESVSLLKDLLIGVTNFFRDPETFEAVDGIVLPEILKDKKSGEQVRVWSTACSTGEEAYSLAMLLRDRIDRIPMPPQLQIFASDIDERAIGIARTGMYPASISVDVSPEHLRQYFAREDNRYCIRKTIRDNVLFAAHNLLRDPPFSRLDLISCRNFLIYLNREIQVHLLEMFHFSLNPGGFLFLGSSESADLASHLFTPVDKKSRIYRAKALSRSNRYALSSPRKVMAATPSEPVMPHTPSQKRQFTFAEIHQRVLAQYAPPSVVVNREYDIVHMSDRAGKYLRHAGGEPSRNLISLVHPEIRLELRTALFQALQTAKSVDARSVKLGSDNRAHFVNMTVRPFHDADADTDLVLVLFDEVEQTMDSGPATSSEGRTDAVLTQLEDELQRTKEQLRETVEHAEVSMEELRASNEELQAVNEEMRSTTEELETSKEELQSVNEELVTVNHELKVKVEETGKANDDLNNLIASADIATIFVDRGMRIKRYTPRASNIFNLISTDIGRSLLDITHRLDYPELANDAGATFETLRPAEREVRSNDGRCYIVRLLPYRTTEERIDGAVMTFFDITSRREAEERLRAGEERLRLAAESMKDYAIMTLDANGCIETWSKGAELMFGYKESEVLGQLGKLIFLEADRERGLFEEEMRRARDEGRVDDNRWHLRKDGTRIYCNGVMTPLHNGSGNVQGYAKIARDETRFLQRDNRRDAALAHEQTERIQAERANATKDEFLASMSHELRNPLNLMYMNAEVLSRLPETRSTPSGARAVETIRSAAMAQAKIIDDLLDLSRLKMGKLALSCARVNLCVLVKSVVEATQSDPAIKDRTIDVESSDEPLVAEVDQGRIEQVLFNLLGNAVKFTAPDGKIAIRVSQKKAEIIVEMSDDGKGLSEDALPHVFDMPGERNAHAMARRGGGLGISLALVKKIVELHGGRIEATSNGAGHGARFAFWLPVEQSEAAAPPAEPPQAQDPIAGMRILLVDDSHEAATSLQHLLELEGATVQVATSAADAMNQAAETDVDLLIAEVALPDMDGYAMMRQIRRQSTYSSLISIAVNASGGGKEVEHAHQSGFSACIEKPLLLEKLLKTISDLRTSAAD
jgi:two-component system CheB/CheR fusion protein